MVRECGGEGAREQHGEGVYVEGKTGSATGGCEGATQGDSKSDSEV